MGGGAKGTHIWAPRCALLPRKSPCAPRRPILWGPPSGDPHPHFGKDGGADGARGCACRGGFAVAPTVSPSPVQRLRGPLPNPNPTPLRAPSPSPPPLPPPALTLQQPLDDAVDVELVNIRHGLSAAGPGRGEPSPPPPSRWTSAAPPLPSRLAALPPGLPRRLLPRLLAPRPPASAQRHPQQPRPTKWPPLPARAEKGRPPRQQLPPPSAALRPPAAHGYTG